MLSKKENRPVPKLRASRVASLAIEARGVVAEEDLLSTKVELTTRKVQYSDPTVKLAVGYERDLYNEAKEGGASISRAMMQCPHIGGDLCLLRL